MLPSEEVEGGWMSPEEREKFLEMVGNVACIKERTECLPALTKRVDDLEKTKTKVAAIVTFVGGGLAYLAQRYLPVLFALAIGSCAGDWPGWHREPDIYVDATMSDECLEATTDALKWMSTYANFNAHYVNGRQSGRYRITIAEGPLDGPLGHNHARTGPAGRILRSDITLERCDARVAAHELGHALGLLRKIGPDDDEDGHRPGTVMCARLSCMEWHLDEDQIAELP